MANVTKDATAVAPTNVQITKGKNFRIRDDFMFIQDGKAMPHLRIVSDSHPDFKSQAHKFHPEPVSDTVVNATADEMARKNLQTELAKIGSMKRDEMVALFTKLRNGKPPPDDATKEQLKLVLIEVSAGEDIDIVAAEAFGVDYANGKKQD